MMSKKKKLIKLNDAVKELTDDKELQKRISNKYPKGHYTERIDGILCVNGRKKRHVFLWGYDTEFYPWVKENYSELKLNFPKDWAGWCKPEVHECGLMIVGSVEIPGIEYLTLKNKADKLAKKKHKTSLENELIKLDDVVRSLSSDKKEQEKIKHRYKLVPGKYWKNVKHPTTEDYILVIENEFLSWSAKAYGIVSIISTELEKLEADAKEWDDYCAKNKENAKKPRKEH